MIWRWLIPFEESNHSSILLNLLLWPHQIPQSIVVVAHKHEKTKIHDPIFHYLAAGCPSGGSGRETMPWPGHGRWEKWFRGGRTVDWFLLVIGTVTVTVTYLDVNSCDCDCCHGLWFIFATGIDPVEGLLKCEGDAMMMMNKCMMIEEV